MYKRILTSKGSNNTKITYNISGNASEYATLLQERYRLGDLHHQQCCHRAERLYVTTTTDNYSHLQACLEGRVKPHPPMTTSTTTTTGSVQPTASTTSAAITTISASATNATSPTTTSTTTTEAPSELAQSTMPPAVMEA
ncbi:threonine-rich protein isoform X2 [Eurosta solidaginis]|uniref:threonine-rich protein isoform X2 n=1 Tax=Eurosta solidaginis TaxID=178769 RepID=UPI0035316200